MKYLSSLFSVFCAIIVATDAADFSVNVGQSGFTYTPNHVSGAVPGDTVTFTFASTIHTVTQGTLASPCTKFSGGFNSGSGVSTFRVTINDTQPIWIYCTTPGHCSSGMVFAINAASDAQLAQYRQNAVSPGSGSTITGAVSSSTASGSGISNPYGNSSSHLAANGVLASLVALLAMTFGIFGM